MNDLLTNDTKAILLLCGAFGNKSSVKPLASREYNAMVRWLVSEEMRPEDLLQEDNADAAAVGVGIDWARFKALLGRGVQLGFAVEEWNRAGIWVLSRSDEEYPARYRNHLKDKAPPLLFGAGERSLLKGGGLAVVGSRNVDSAGENFARHVAEMCAINDMPVVSGGARGVDRIAMASALEAGGTVIGVLAENLLRASLERNARNALNEGRMLLISPYHPKARFTVGTAMGRNKLIYAMADYGLVVSADYNRGGSWSGAKEELNRKSPLILFVRSGSDVPDGNRRLIEIGALEWPDVIDRNDLAGRLAEAAEGRPIKKIVENMNLFDSPRQRGSLVEEPGDEGGMPGRAIFNAVLPVILETLESPSTLAELAEALDVSKAQLGKWLKEAISQGFVRKLKHPVRYERCRRKPPIS